MSDESFTRLAFKPTQIRRLVRLRQRGKQRGMALILYDVVPEFVRAQMRNPDEESRP